MNSGVPYFSNTKTNATTWDPPAEGFVDATTTAVSQAAPDPYAASATFNRATGRFEYANGGNYWDAKGIPQDREGRMMSHYFDLDSLEQNRAEAAAKKQKLKHKKYDWRKYKAAKKKEKVKRQVQKQVTRSRRSAGAAGADRTERGSPGSSYPPRRRRPPSYTKPGGGGSRRRQVQVARAARTSVVDVMARRLSQTLLPLLHDF